MSRTANEGLALVNEKHNNISLIEISFEDISLNDIDLKMTYP